MIDLGLYRSYILILTLYLTGLRLTHISTNNWVSFQMPPKGRPKRSKPYDGQKKSASKAVVDSEIPHPDIILPGPSTSVITVEPHRSDVVMADVECPRADVSSVNVQQPDLNSTDVLPVTRYEFVQLQKSMAEMSSFMKSFMSSVQGGNVKDQSQMVNESHLLQPPMVIVNQPSSPSISRAPSVGRASPATVISHQPAASMGRASPSIGLSRPVSPTPMAENKSVCSLQPGPSTPLPGTPIRPVMSNLNVENQAMLNSNLSLNIPEMQKSSPARPIRFPANTEDAVQSAVNYHLSSIVNPGESFNHAKVSYQVDRRIPDKTLQAIWEDKYIDLTNMIPKEVDPDAPLQLVQGKPGEAATWAPVKSSKFIDNISQWSDLFDIYVAAYSRKHPGQTPNLMTHKFNVTQLASDGADFLFYDVEFRKAHAKYGIPWENPDMQLWVKAANKGIQSSLALAIGSNQVTSNVSNVTQSQSVKSQNNSFRSNKGSSAGSGNKLRHPSGYCFHFHNKRCGKTNCRFLHQCWMPGCGERHSVYKCPKLQNQSNKFSKSNSSSGAKQSSTANANKG